MHFAAGPDFEGAQGLMLDEEYKFFPNVTPSATGLKNPVDIVSIEFGPSDQEEKEAKFVNLDLN